MGSDLLFLKSMLIIIETRNQNSIIYYSIFFDNKQQLLCTFFQLYGIIVFIFWGIFMKERWKNIFAYAGIVFNIIIGINSVYTTAKDITEKPFGIFVIIVTIIGFCACIALIVDKAYKPLSEKSVALTEGFIDFAEKHKCVSFGLRECFHTNANDPIEFKKEILRGCFYLVSQTEKVLRNALGKKVRVCIKMFREDSKEFVFTYCRDSLTIDQSIKKEHGQRIDVTKNSDFSDIINGNRDYFLGSTLKKDYKEKKYHNTNSDFKYESAVVVPIRMLVTEVCETNRDVYDTIGFLCIDSKHKHLFDSAQAKMCVDFIQSVAHFLYVFISQGNEYYDSIKASVEEVIVNG